MSSAADEVPDVKEIALAALRATLNPTLHTDNCMGMRAAGVRNCTHVCAKVRAAVEQLTGEPLAGADWPGELAPDDPPTACPACGGAFHFGGGGYCPKCGAPFLMTADPARPHRVYVHLSISGGESPEMFRKLNALVAGHQPAFGFVTTTPTE